MAPQRPKSNKLKVSIRKHGVFVEGDGTIAVVIAGISFLGFVFFLADRLLF